MTLESAMERETEVFSLKNLAGRWLSSPQKLIIDLPMSIKKWPFDIGVIAYFKNTYLNSKASRSGTPYIVVEDSLLEHRCEFIRKLIDHIIASGYSDNSALTVMTKIRSAFSRINKYEGSELFLKSIEETQDFYKKINNELRHEVGISKITPRNAQQFQSKIFQIISINYDASVSNYISRNSIRFSGDINKTLPREISELRYAAEVYESLAISLTSFLLENTAFPCLLKMPGYETYLFPYSNHRVTPYCHRPAHVYNYELGRIATEREFFSKIPDRKESVLRQDLKKAHRNMEIANLDPRSKSRKALAATAMQSYQMLFMMLTGTYISEISKIEFDGDFEISKSITNKSFRVIKLRAAGRVLQYELAARGVHILRSYMKLRTWVLNGKKMEFLFFGLKSKTWDALQVSDANIRSFQDKKIISIFMPSNFRKLTSRQFRKTKSIFLHEEPSVAKETVGIVLNHSVTTNESHYMEVSPEKSRKEFSKFWEAVNEAADHIRVVETDDLALHRKTASGHCDSYLSPETAIDSPPIIPDCKSQYGCLFCSHYICHANDEEDVHKLLSLLYIITGVMRGSSDEDKARELFSTLESRVRKILFQIKIKSKSGRKNLELYSRRVFELGELTLYWENRLQRYEALGMIFINSEEGLLL